MSNTQALDAIIIGAGIAGTSIGYFLSNHARVLVLERESHPGVHSTGRSAALFSETYGPPQVRALTRASRAFFERPPRDFVAHELLAPRGALVIASEAQRARVQNDYESMRQDVPGLQLLDEAAMRARVPVLEPAQARHGLFEAGAADIDVNSLHQGFIRGLKQRGSRLECAAQIHSMERSQGEWLLEVTLRGARHALRTPIVVNAAGAWADEIAALAGVRPLGVEPRRRTAFLFAPPDGVEVSHWPFVTSVDEDFYFKPDAGLLLGSPANADPSPAHDVQPEDLDIALAIDAIERATSMRIERPLRPWAGLRSFVGDGGLVGGFDASDRAGFFWAAALGGYGIQTSAAMGEACANLVLGRALPSHVVDAGITPAALGPARLTTAAPA